MMHKQISCKSGWYRWTVLISDLAVSFSTFYQKKIFISSGSFSKLDQGVFCKHTILMSFIDSKVEGYISSSSLSSEDDLEPISSFALRLKLFALKLIRDWLLVRCGRYNWIYVAKYSQATV